MLTTVEEPEAAGISNVEWDAVELPSQFMENWCLDQSTLMGMARHWQTGEPLPQDEVDKLRNSRSFNAGLATLRQVHFALTDLRLHSQWTPQLGLSPDELRRDIANTTTVITETVTETVNTTVETVDTVESIKKEEEEVLPGWAIATICVVGVLGRICLRQ